MLIYKGHTDRVNSVAFSPNGQSVVSASDDRTIRIWHKNRPSRIGRHGLGVYSVSHSPLGNRIASGSQDKTIRLWDKNTGQQSGAALKGNHTFLSIAFSPDATLIASGCGSDASSSIASAVRLWSIRKRKAVSSPFKGHTDDIESVSFSPKGTQIVSGSYDKTIRVWDVERATTIAGPFEGHTAGVRSTTFSPDGAQIVSCSGDRTIRFWDARSGEIIGEQYEGHTGCVQSISYSPCGTYVASGGDDATVRLWDIRTGRQVGRSFEEHTGAVYSVAFSPCGQYIASGSKDRRVIIRNTLCESLDRDENSDSNGVPGPQIVTSQMSTRDMFQCLVDVGCNDLSSTMDINQDAARIISGGGFGDIWMAQLHDGTKVAIKAWRTDALEQCRYKTLKRAARELYYWSRIKHNNIHRLMGVIIFRDGYLGMVSEWMENGDLHKYLRHHPEADRYQLCLDVASGVEYMHGQSMVHGDLKAANVLVSSDGVARLSDFDFSVMSEAGDLVFSASSNTRSGSIRWVAPEMLDGEAPKRTTESDVYALGMTILEVFTGRVPYSDRRMDTAVILAVMQGALPTRQFQHFKDDERGNLLWSLLLDCWSRDPGERPSAGMVVEVLESCAGKT